jgi:RNA polymerase sigma-70 factor (ECF subfamily)
VSEDDRRLVARMRAGERSAFDGFFAAYAQRLAAFVSRRSTLDPAGVEDMVQRTLIKAIRNLDSFRGDAALFTWLCTICRHEIASVRRKEGRQPIHESIDAGGLARDLLSELAAPAESEPLQELEQASQRNAVARVLNRLPERYARVLEWKYGDGFSVEEIAGMLGLTVTAVQSLLARARKEFKDLWVREHAS